MSSKDKSAPAPEDFVKNNLDGMEAVIVRIGAGEAQLVLVDSEGRWERWVYDTVDDCKAKAESLGITEVHAGAYPEATRVRMNSYQRDAASYGAGAYPEQGRIGPVIPYPENRPRPAERLPEEAARDRED